MKKIQVEIEGATPLLMNSPHMMMEESEKKLKRKTTDYDHKEEAEKVAYRTEDGKLYVPSTAIKGCLINAASYQKIGKYAAKPIVAGGVRIEPIEIDLGTKDYKIDLRTVVIQRNRVVKARPRLDTWKAKFTIVYNENLIGNHDIIRQFLEEGGERVGILDFSPRNKGEFGTFKVTKWLPVS
jgi:hypothetical protein